MIKSDRVNHAVILMVSQYVNNPKIVQGFSMTISIQFSAKPKSKPTAKIDTVVIPLYKGLKFVDAKNMYKKSVQSALKLHSDFEAKEGEIITSFSSDQRVVIVGLGDKKDLNPIAFEKIGGKIFNALKTAKAQAVCVCTQGLGEEATAHFAYGLHLKSYQFTKYKTDKAKTKLSLKSVQFVHDEAAKAKKVFKDLNAIADGVFLARDLINEPPNTLYPESYAKRIQQELKPLGVEVEILNEAKMTKLGFKSLLSVGQGSARESQCVIMRWNGTGRKISKTTQNPVALVGKGVTFDTGGISLKPGAGMDLMKMDMGGSAAVVGAMKAIASRKAKANVIGIVGLVENMPSSNAYRPGDIIGSLSGKTIEVLNTDAEGRLVLADVLTYVQQTYKADTVIDLATLTGAIMVALGYEYAGAFVNNDSLWDQLDKAGADTGENLWRMPLDKAYKKEMESEVADLKNMGNSRWGGACTAAGFLEHFVEEDTKWAHIDIAGTAWWNNDKDTTPKGGTGFAVRTLDRFIKNNYES